MMPTTDNPDDGTIQTEMTEMGEVPAQSADVGASLPNPEEVRAAGNVSNRPKNGRFCLIIFVFATLLLTGVAIALGVTLGDSDSGESFARRSTPEEIQDYIVDQGVSTSDLFLLTEGAQTKAVEWMAFEDRLNLPTPVQGVSPSESRAAYEFVLRYVMTVLYYSMNGPEWSYQFSFLSEKETCNWNGLLQNSQGNFFPFGLICNQDREAFQIFLDNLELEGELPNELQVLTTLRQLDFSFNEGISGEFRDWLCDMENLTALSIGFTGLSGSLPACVSRLSELRLLFLSNNNLSGNLPSLNGMDNLERLFLDDNDLTGDISSAFNTLLELKFVFLDNNDFSGSLDDTFMADSDKLIQLDISGNFLSGDVPIHMFEFPEVQVIDLHDNGLDGDLPSNYPTSNLLFLALHDNDLTGDIDPSISNLYNLFHLDLSSNGLTGDIVSEIGEMTNLTYLFLGQNNYDEAFFPDSFANLTNMEEFSVKSSNLLGGLPEYISTWTSLKLLDMDDNQFQGPIPSSWGDLVNLEFLLLNDNPLIDGDFPSSFKKLVNLRAGFFETTQIAGNMTIMCELPNFQELDNDLDGDELLVANCGPTGTVTCGCCGCCGSINEDKLCNDHELIANLNPTWEFVFDRVTYNFGNDTRFVDREYIN